MCKLAPNMKDLYLQSVGEQQTGNGDVIRRIYRLIHLSGIIKEGKRRFVYVQSVSASEEGGGQKEEGLIPAGVSSHSFSTGAPPHPQNTNSSSPLGS